jgi:hypothetical protein
MLVEQFYGLKLNETEPKSQQRFEENMASRIWCQGRVILSDCYGDFECYIYNLGLGQLKDET